MVVSAERFVLWLFEHMAPSVGSWRPKFDIKHFECHERVVGQQCGDNNQDIRHPKCTRLNQMIVNAHQLSVPHVEEIVR